MILFNVIEMNASMIRDLYACKEEYSNGFVYHITLTYFTKIQCHYLFIFGDFTPRSSDDYKNRRIERFPQFPEPVAQEFILHMFHINHDNYFFD
jgi:hypothetical protein